MVELRRLLPDAKLQFLTGDAPDAALLEKLLMMLRDEGEEKTFKYLKALKEY
jgi:hypothetical protein